MPTAGLAEPAQKSVEEYQHVEPLVRKYCFECHGPKMQEADIGLHKFTNAESVLEDRASWEAVLEMVEFGAMPPEDRPQPTEAERRKLVDWLKQTLFAVDCTLDRDPGRVTIQRLNRAEYDNTIRDLIGLDLKLAKDFPSDDVGEGFDNIGDVLSLPPLLMEKYMDAAEKVAQAAIVAPGADNAPVREGKRWKGSGSAKQGGDGAWHIYSAGAVTGEFDVPRDGKYVVRIEAMGDQAGSEPARMAVRLDDKELQVVDVPAPRDDPTVYEVPLQAKKGGRRISAAFINDYYKPKDPNPRNRDRNLYVRRLELVGPLDVKPDELPETHRRIVVARPESGKSLRDAATEVLWRFASRAYRRPATPEDIELFVRLVEMAVQEGESYERGIQIALSAVLVSPQFLFRIEQDHRPDDPEAVHPLNDFELASRLSYFLWSSMPDKELFSLARAGKLNDEETLRRQVVRMLEDPKSDALVENFGSQWLNLRNLNEVSPDPTQFAGFNDELRSDMLRETELFFAEIIREDRSVLDFISGDFTFLNQRLAEHYGMAGDIQGEQFQRVPLGDGRRAGVLTHASVLTLTSNPTRTSPVKRGKWIMDNILGTPPPEPPPNIPLLEEVSEANPNVSLREQMELHRKDPTCASCHRQMDALGFGFENFDAIGRWRDKDGAIAVDPSGELPSGEKFETPADLIRILAERRDGFSRSLSEKMLTYALGRGLTPHDQCAVDEIVEALKKNDYRFSALVTGIVLSEPLRMRRGEGATP